jgi:hypothetical protein
LPLRASLLISISFQPGSHCACISTNERPDT